MNEIWLPIKGCEGSYSVSNLGRVMSHERAIPHRRSGFIRIKQRVLKQNINKSHGYLVVNILRNGVQRPLLVHRLVAETFLGECPIGYECAHKDGDKTNPRLDNLRWSNHTDNNRDKVTHGTQISGESVNLSRLKADQVREIKRLNKSQHEIAKIFGVHQSTISKILCGHTWKHI